MRAKSVVPTPSLEFDLQRASNHRKPFSHARYAERPVLARCAQLLFEFEAVSVIVDRQLNHRARAIDDNANLLRFAARVLQCW